MDRIRKLNRFQKSVLLVTLVMALLFTAVYISTLSRTGLAYRDAILTQSEESGNTLYKGTVNGTQAQFTVYPDHTVCYQYGDKHYGPYTFTEDPSALPEGSGMPDFIAAGRLADADKTLFDGGIMKTEGFIWLFNKDGSIADTVITVTTGYDAILTDEDGNIIDPNEPSAATVLDLIFGPELTHKGYAGAWVGGMLMCIAAILSILFADELFRFNLSFRIRNAGDAEPSDWEIARRCLSWVILPVIALILFITGLR